MVHRHSHHSNFHVGKLHIPAVHMPKSHYKFCNFRERYFNTIYRCCKKHNRNF